MSVSAATVNTAENFTCVFTPTGTGTLNVNVSWYVFNTSSWSAYTANDQTISTTTGVEYQTNPILSSATLKHQYWRCELTLYNETDTLIQNSSNVTIENHLPLITAPLVNQTAYEDQAFSLQANATDYDGDGVTWTSSDLSSGSYGGTALFTITSGGLISFTRTDETLVGTHRMLLTALDSSTSPLEGSVREVYFELIAVNDAPIITSTDLNFSCEEDGACSGSIEATDEENDTLTFTSNTSFIDMATDGTFSFTPAFAQIGYHVVNVTVNDSEDIDSVLITFEINETNRAPNITSITNPAALQNQSENFIFYINATDNNTMDNLTFNVTTQSCSSNPWTITTLTNGSTNASAIVNVSLNNNNNYVVCRDVTLSVTDGKTTVYQNVTFNITNTNDAPTIAQNSTLGDNILYDIENLTTSTGADFSYTVNASDNDSLTYEGEILNYSLSGHNSSLFTIDSATGEVTSVTTVNSSFLGDHSFFVVVTDDGGLSYNRTINISVVNNERPVIVTTMIADCTENQTCQRNILGQDAENDNLSLISAGLLYTDPQGNETTYNYTQTISYLNISYSSFSGNQTDYSMDIFPADEHVGNYSFNITLRDTYGLTITAYYNFSIINVNDAPYIGRESDSEPSDSLTFSTIVVNQLFSILVYGIDEDLLYSQDNLTFNFSFAQGDIASTTFTKTAANAANLSFTPQSGEDGATTINLTVTDSSGASNTKQVSFTVYNVSLAPQVDHITPSMSNGSLNTSLVPANGSGITYINISENTTVNFNLNATDTESFNLTWYRNGTRIFETTYGTHNYTINFGFFEANQTNITVELEDIYFSSANYTWITTVANLNRAPLFINNRSDLSVIDGASISGIQTITAFFRQTSASDIVFIDPDDDLNGDGILTGNETNTLTFSVNESSECATDYAEFSFNDDGDLTITPSSTGTCYTTFIATDEDGAEVVSNEIRIDILESAENTGSSSGSSGGTTTRTRTISVPLEEEVEVPEEFSLLDPGIASIYDQGNVVIPIRLYNSWTDPLEAITLTANISSDYEYDIDFEFSQSYIEYMPVGAAIDLNLTMFRYRADAPFEVNISAYIESLDYTDSAVVYINALERGKEDLESLKTRIGFARDLLNDNPECQELNELLDQAEDNIAAPNTLQVINQVINGCKYLVNEAKSPRSELPKSFLGTLGIFEQEKIGYSTLISTFMVLVMGALIVAVMVQFRLKRI